MNGTIMEKARTMLLEARLPESFWADAVFIYFIFLFYSYYMEA